MPRCYVCRGTGRICDRCFWPGDCSCDAHVWLCARCRGKGTVKLEWWERLLKNGRVLTFDGQTKTVVEWARLIGVKYCTLIKRLDTYNWPVSRALSTETLKRGGNKRK